MGRSGSRQKFWNLSNNATSLGNALLKLQMLDGNTTEVRKGAESLGPSSFLLFEPQYASCSSALGLDIYKSHSKVLLLIRK